MGQDKARLPGPDGRGLAARLDALLRAAGAAGVLAVGGVRDPALGLPWIPDLRSDCGPLGGLEAALARGGVWWVLACDLVGLEVADLRRLREAGDPAVATVGGRLQPLCGVYGPAQLPPLRAALDAGRRRAVEVVAGWDPRRIELPGLANLNTPEDYAGWLTPPSGNE